MSEPEQTEPQPCAKCHGYGIIGSHSCPRCRGTGAERGASPSVPDRSVSVAPLATPSPNDCPDPYCHARDGMPAECFAEAVNAGAFDAADFTPWPAGDRCPMLGYDEHAEERADDESLWEQADRG